MNHTKTLVAVRPSASPTTKNPFFRALPQFVLLGAGLQRFITAAATGYAHPDFDGKCHCVVGLCRQRGDDSPYPRHMYSSLNALIERRGAACTACPAPDLTVELAEVYNGACHLAGNKDYKLTCTPPHSPLDRVASSEPLPGVPALSAGPSKSRDYVLTSWSLLMPRYFTRAYDSVTSSGFITLRATGIKYLNECFLNKSRQASSDYVVSPSSLRIL